MSPRPSAPRASVVIPARNEAETIGRCLETLLGPEVGEDLHVVVSCNGCTDATADVARRTADDLGRPVEVIESPAPGKAHAIRLAESTPLGFPRLYLDADVYCPASTVRALLDAVRSGADLAVPERHLDLGRCSWAARQYYSYWEGLPWVREQMAGRGAYAFGPHLRSSYDLMPLVIADDRFVTTRVPRERAVIVAAPVTISPPRTLLALVRVRSRVYRGNSSAAVPTHDGPAVRRFTHLVASLPRPRSWPGLAVFAAVTLVVRLQRLDELGFDALTGGGV